MPEALTGAFLSGQIGDRPLSHADHVCVTFDLLQQNSFMTAAGLLSAGLRSHAARVGNPRAFNQTFTLAFLSLIAERRIAGHYASADAFMSANLDLRDKSVITRWYNPARLSLDIARDIFILPEPLR